MADDDQSHPSRGGSAMTPADGATNPGTHRLLPRAPAISWWMLLLTTVAILMTSVDHQILPAVPPAGLGAVRAQSRAGRPHQLRVLRGPGRRRHHLRLHLGPDRHRVSTLLDLERRDAVRRDRRCADFRSGRQLHGLPPA